MTVKSKIETALKEGKKSLSLVGMKMKNLPPEISQLTDLETLDLSDNHFRGIAPLLSLTSLKQLSLRNCSGVRDFSGLAQLKNLEVLYLTNNFISDPSFLSELTNLRELHLNNCGVKDPSVIAGLKHLEVVDLISNDIEDVSALEGLTNLRTLALSRNKISDVSSLAGLRALKTLGLSNNKIVEIAPLQDLSKLSCLYLRGNAIRDISPLKPLMENGLKAVTFFPEPSSNFIGLSSNPLEMPPVEVASKGNESILAYFDENSA